MEFINGIKDTIKDAATEAKQEFIDSLKKDEGTDEEGKKGVNPKVVVGAIIFTAGLGYFAWTHYEVSEKIQKKTVEKITKKLNEMGYEVVKKKVTEEKPAETPTEETK